jgi:hypothetical protein
MVVVCEMQPVVAVISLFPYAEVVGGTKGNYFALVSLLVHELMAAGEKATLWQIK